MTVIDSVSRKNASPAINQLQETDNYHYATSFDGQFIMAWLSQQGIAPDVIPTGSKLVGCFFHGCPDCFDGDAPNPLLGLTMNALFEKTRAVSTKLQKAGYVLVQKQEHEFRKEIELDAELQKFI
ncbi:hypothetical protein AVEN_102531-1 [Araneus ventricosus]|uniref:Uncharacterized protein n=1 Tax=Araneus ventricosus TaxID=182803 RepID=A0A4Y2BJ33_ARAVE|nr:hypothetical protein AVEN_102531-1 [Araneus ventricosus]